MATKIPEYGIINTKKITELIFTEKLYLASDDNFYPSIESSRLREPLTYKTILPFLKLIRNECADYYNCNLESINYEDLFYYCRLLDYEKGWRKHPGLGDYFNNLNNKIVQKNINTNDGTAYTLWDILIYAQKYISQVIMIALSKLTNPIGYEWIGNAINDCSYDLQFVTLNHDLLLENYLRSIGKNCCDGFFLDESIESYIFSPITLRKSNSIKLIKIHGSIDWETFGGISNCNVIKTAQKISRLKLLQKYGDTHGTPTILAGTHNKLEGYAYGIFSDLMTEFNILLYEADIIVICGYGFGDRGINSRLSNWLRLDIKNQIIVIHHDKEKLKRNLEHHAAQLLNLIDPKRIHFEEKKFEDIQWDDVKKFM